MTPLYFGERQRRLFGVYTPAHASGARPRAAVLCAPWGAEHLRAHRSIAQLAKWLAEAGVHVLRFDYFGTGDSAGDMRDARIDGWVDDVQTAIDELKDTTGLQRVTLIGHRMGAVLAARAAARNRRDIDWLVLWDPVLQGGEQLAQLRALHAEGLRTRGLAAGPLELLGFAMTDELIADLASLDLLQPRPNWSARTLALLSQQGPVPAALSAALAEAGAPPPEQIEALPAWLEDRSTGAGAVPVRLLRRIVEGVQA